MIENELRHLAIVAGGALGTPGNEAVAVAGATRTAARMAVEAFAAEPGLQAFSFHAPGIDLLLAEPATAAMALDGCLQAEAILEETAARCGAGLRLCGRTEGLPDALTRHTAQSPAPVSGRMVLWFLRYGGRDEVARAAARFFRARPGEALTDEELDAWLDTAGVPDPDLIVHAGGAFEATDALVWQGSYAELWHTTAPWSAFTSDDLRRAIADFHHRQRRFGG